MHDALQRLYCVFGGSSAAIHGSRSDKAPESAGFIAYMPRLSKSVDPDLVVPTFASMVLATWHWG